MSNILYIKLWCEYDISGTFGGNNNEEILAIPEDFTGSVPDLLREHVNNRCPYLEEDDEGLWDYEYIDVFMLGSTEWNEDDE